MPSGYEMRIVSAPIFIVTGQVCLIRSTTVWLGLWKGMPKSPCSTFQT